MQDFLGLNLAEKAWFRGQSDGSKYPLPAVLRTDVAQAIDRTNDRTWPTSGDQNMLSEFWRRGSRMLPAPEDPVDVYFQAQHHGLPTLLLDWTTDPLAALYFAVREPRSGVDGGLFVLNPVYRFAGGTGGPPPDSIPIVGPVSEEHFVPTAWIKLAGRRWKELPDRLPRLVASIAVWPRLRDGRMSQQGSCFTLHPPAFHQRDEFSHYPAGKLAHFRIPSDSKYAIKRQLRHLGITETRLFPDLDHLVADLLEEFLG
ncbi:MAG: FRG domain-containing protein [Dehalococcoidia bacterium]|nr:FRG domain-containing protein [Dehalococcoidia bacterium]